MTLFIEGTAIRIGIKGCSLVGPYWRHEIYNKEIVRVQEEASAARISTLKPINGCSRCVPSDRIQLRIVLGHELPPSVCTCSTSLVCFLQRIGQPPCFSTYISSRTYNGYGASIFIRPCIRFFFPQHHFSARSSSDWDGAMKDNFRSKRTVYQDELN